MNALRSPAGVRAIGVDVGGTKILAGVVADDGSLVRRSERPTPIASQADLLAALDGAVDDLLGDDVAALGFGLPSRIDQRSGRAIASVNVPLADLAFRERMQTRFGLPVGIDNDANVAAIAEWQVGAARGASHVVMLTLGTGIGGGLILDGRPYRGATGAGAELGHIVVEYGGPRCPCGGSGHVEAFASGRAADEAARGLLGGAADAADLVGAANGGDAAAKEVLAAIGRRLGAAMASLVNIFEPEVIVVGGGFAAAGELILAPARAVVEAEALAPARDRVRVVVGALGPEAGLIGAGLLGFEALEAAV